MSAFNLTDISVVRMSAKDDGLPSFTFMFTVILGLVTILGNSVVLLAIRLTPSFRSAPDFYLASLAAADLLVGLTLVFRVCVHSSLHHLSEMVQKMSCLAFISFAATSLMASVLSLTLVSLDRCLSISRPLAYKSHSIQRRTRFAILGAWLCAFMYGVLPCVFNKYTDQRKCLMMLQVEDWYVRYLTTGLLTAGIVVSLLCYCKIGYIFLDHQRNITVIRCSNQRTTPKQHMNHGGRRLIQIRVKSQSELTSTAITCDIQMIDGDRAFGHMSSKSSVAHYDRGEPDQRFSEYTKNQHRYLESNKRGSISKSNTDVRTTDLCGDQNLQTKGNGLFCCSAACEERCVKKSRLKNSENLRSNHSNSHNSSEVINERPQVQRDESSSSTGSTAAPSAIHRKEKKLHTKTSECVEKRVISVKDALQHSGTLLSHSAAVEAGDNLTTDDTIDTGNVSRESRNIQRPTAEVISEDHRDLARQRSSESMQSLQIVLREPSVARHTVAKDMSRNSRCLIKMVFLTQMVFTACMLPSVIFFFLYGLVEIPGWLMTWIPLVAFFNSAVNVFIYAGYNVKYRAAIGSVLRCRC